MLSNGNHSYCDALCCPFNRGSSQNGQRKVKSNTSRKSLRVQCVPITCQPEVKSEKDNHSRIWGKSCRPAGRNNNNNNKLLPSAVPNGMIYAVTMIS